MSAGAVLSRRPEATGDSAAVVEADGLAVWRKRVEGTNINPTTLLATDYLNHFNEIIMLLGMVPDMPEILEDCRAWAPKTYQEHFRDSGFRDTELAIAAYENCPSGYRVPFENTIAQLEAGIASGIVELTALAATENETLLSMTAEQLAKDLQRLLERAAAIINGSAVTLNQEEIDRLVGASHS